MLAALNEGVSALVLRVGDTGVAPAQLDRLLAGVFLDHGTDHPRCRDADYAATADACWR